MSQSSKSNLWCVRTEEGVAGPYTVEQLRAMVIQGTVNRHTPIRAEGGSSWIRAGQYPAIFTPSNASELSSAPPPRNVEAPTPPPMRKAQAAPSRPPSKAPWVMAIGLALVFLVGAVFLILSPTSSDELANKDKTEKSELPGGNAASASNKKTEPDENTGNRRSSDSSKSFSTEDIVSMTEHAVVTVLAGDGVGSGFVVAPNIVATNYHVIADDDGDRISCFFSSASGDKRGPFAARLVAEEPKADLALLRIECEVKPIQLADNANFRRGQDVVAIGTPALFNGQDILPNAITRGVVSSQHDLFGEPRYQLSMAINPGNSGGPVIGLDGKVVGVVVSKSRTEEGIGFCVPASSLKRLMESCRTNNYAVTDEARSQHLARVTARELVTLTLDLEKFLVQLAKVIEDKSGANAQQLPANVFAEILNGVITEVNPGIRKDFSSQLEQIAEDDHLSPRLRSELSTLLQRHLALHAAIARPTGNVQSMIGSIGNLRDRFLDQLRKVDKLLPLGFPELVE